MSNEELEAKLVQKTVTMLRMARQVIKKMNADEDGFQEEPSLSDLVLVAQIIGQTSTIDRLGEMGMPEKREGPTLVPLSPEGHPIQQSLEGAIAIGVPMVPDIIVFWSPDGWYVNAHPEFQWEAQGCRNLEELSSVLQQLAVVCVQRRTPQDPP